MAIQRVALDRLSPEVRAFLAQANDAQGVWVEDPRTQERYCVVKFREPSSNEQHEALSRLSQMGAEVQTTLEQRGMSVEDAEREIQEAIAEVRREKARL